MTIFNVGVVFDGPLDGSIRFWLCCNIDGTEYLSEQAYLSENECIRDFVAGKIKWFASE